MFFTRRSSVIWGIMLLCWGGFYFLNAFNIIRINIWGLFFPTMLIVWGVWALTGSNFFPWSRSPRKTSLSLPLKKSKASKVRIEHRRGRLNLDNQVYDGQLISGRFSSGVEYDLQRENGLAELDLRGDDRSWSPWSWNGCGPDRSSYRRAEHHHRDDYESRYMWPGMGSSWGWGTSDRQRWDISLNGKIVLDLNIDLTDSSSRLDLRKMNLNNLNLKAQDSEIDLRLPSGKIPYQLSLNGEFSDYKLTIPLGAAVRINAVGNWAKIDIDESRFPLNGDYYQSPDYVSSNQEIDIVAYCEQGKLQIR